MSIKRFNPTCAGVRVWYIMSPVGTRGLTWALGSGNDTRRSVRGGTERGDCGSLARWVPNRRPSICQVGPWLSGTSDV